MRVIGIDPGLAGAVACVENRHIVWMRACPVIGSPKGKHEFDERAMAKIIRDESAYADMVVIEKVHAMPMQGVVSMFRFGTGFGIWLGILASNPVAYELVTPQMWMRDMLKGAPGDDTKQKGLIVVKRLYADFGEGKKIGEIRNLVDAVLIATWGVKFGGVGR